MELTQHPLSAAFPAMSPEEFQELKDDIDMNGQCEPVVVLDNMVLDGWHRYRACSELGLQPILSTLAPDHDPVAFVISHNLKRRHHLTASQRAAAVVACSAWAPPGRPKNAAPGAGYSTSKELATTASVSERTIRQAKTAHKAGLSDQVKTGKLTVKEAAARARGKSTARLATPKAPKRAPWDAPGPGGDKAPAQPEDTPAADLAAIEQLRADLSLKQARIDELVAETAKLKCAPASVPPLEDGAPEPGELATTARELAAERERLAMENESLRKITQSDDKLAVAVAELEQQRKENGVLHARNNDLLTDNAKLVKKVKQQEARIDALMGEVAELLGHNMALQSKLPACYGEDRVA